MRISNRFHCINTQAGRGFTLIEILLVLVILSTLAAVCTATVASASDLAPIDRDFLSEKVFVSISSTDAMFNATFRSDSHERLDSSSPGLGAYMVQIWFPDVGRGRGQEEAFWGIFHMGFYNFFYDPQKLEHYRHPDGEVSWYITNSTAKAVFETSVGLKVHVGARVISLAHGIEGFLAMPSGWPQPKDPTTTRFFADLSKAMHLPKPEPDEFVLHEDSREPGFAHLLVWFDEPTDLVDTRTPMTLTYRQPLLPDKEAGRFFYLPGLRSGGRAADISPCSVTLVATNCTVKVTCGGQESTIESGQRLTLTPKPHQGIRAISIPRPN